MKKRTHDGEKFPKGWGTVGWLGLPNNNNNKKVENELLKRTNRKSD